MANTKSAAKRARQTERRTIQNKNALTKVKNLLKDARVALKSKNKETATAEYRKLTSALDKAVKTGRIQSNTANRHKSSLNKQLVALA
ncbi:MAG: 30S ribosomal protein S20 [Verrucomicrobiota bacterium]